MSSIASPLVLFQHPPNTRRAEARPGVRHDNASLAAQPNAETPYCAISGSNLLCMRPGGLVGAPIQPTLPLLLGPKRKQVGEMCKRLVPPLREVLAMHRAAGPESPPEYMAFGHDLFLTLGGYVRFLCVNYVAWRQECAIEKRNRERLFAEASLRSLSEVDAVLTCIEEMETEQALPAEGRDGERTRQFIGLRRKLVEWEQQKGEWSTPGLRALVEFWSALYHFRDGVGAELLIDVQNEAAEGEAILMGRDSVRLEQDIFRRLEDTYRLIYFRNVSDPYNYFTFNGVKL